MSVLIFRLNGVSEDEAEDVRQLFISEGVDFYETSAGRWGVSVAALWLKSADDTVKAKALIATYQQGRREWLTAVKQQAIAEGRWPNAWQRFKAAPLAFVSVILVVAAIIAVSVLPFVSI